MKKLLTLALVAICIIAAVLPTVCFADSGAAAMAPSSKESLLMSETGEVLHEHNATEKRPIASMTKVMTLMCVYEAIDNGKMTLDDKVVVSKNAASMGGSQVFLDANTTHKASDLIKSIIVCSANDSCVALAEHISGSVDGFVKHMNDTAKAMGLGSTHFANCTGLPAANHYSSALDVAKMMLKLINNKHYFQCSRVWTEDYRHPDGRLTNMTNTNKLIRFYDGCDGGKTGFTNEAQHCLAATAKRGDTRFIAVVVGAPDSKTRFKEVSDMFNYGFANYESKVMLDTSTKLDPVKVIGGKQSVVDVVPAGKLIAFSKKGVGEYVVVLEYDDNVRAPLAAGDVVGKAKLVDGAGNIVRETPLTASATVEKKGYMDYLFDSIYR
jgi:D-alanyl-D-alanine carboxypeptidase (penicillin-binding protein 5/6)